MGYDVQDNPSAQSSDDRTWGMLAHLSPLVLGFVGPLVIWLIYKDKISFCGGAS